MIALWSGERTQHGREHRVGDRKMTESAAAGSSARRSSRDQRGKQRYGRGVSDREWSQTCVISPGAESVFPPSLVMLSLLLHAIGTITTASPSRIQNAKPEIFRMFPPLSSFGEYSGGNSTV